MNFIGNIIWLIFGGLLAALGYLVGGILLCCTLVGIPFGWQCFKIAGVVLAPFGKKVVDDNTSMGCFSVFANIIWLLCGGLYTACMHLIWGILLAITIIGLPFAQQHFKLIGLSLMPFGKKVI